MPSSTDTMRARLKPCSPLGSAHPSIRSSISRGSSCGTLSSAARTIWAARSSGRTAVMDPLAARPIGERAVATMTASGMTQCPFREILPRKLAEFALCQGSLVHLVRAVGEAERTRGGPHLGQRERLADPAAAVDLDGLVEDPFRHLRHHDLDRLDLG